ncbi:hypothetical protein QFA96_18585 [Pseudomonas sp. Ap32]|uniref:Uncharacterized protein n=1 Tax=Pseudomonas sp. 13.2 TaxID=3144665 RepID=A0AAU7BI36_9PSED|nr:hypothetical protein QFA96_18585 [Pseudomonas sp. Ap32]
MNKLEKIRHFAIDTNGVLLSDVYSTPIRTFVERHGGHYTADLERQILGSPHMAGGTSWRWPATCPGQPWKP